MDSWTIQDYVAAFVEGGELRFAREHRQPVLLHRDTSSADEDAKFETAYLPRTLLEDSSDDSEAALTLPPEGEKGGEKRAPMGRVFKVTKREGAAFEERIGIGRARNADVCLPMSKISKYHAFLTHDDDGVWSVTDAGSRNGTRVDGRSLEARVAHPLADGSELRLGPYRFVFFTPDGFLKSVRRRAALQS